MGGRVGDGHPQHWYLSVSALIALLVFEKLGVGLLRKAWFNVDLLWAIALIVTSVATVVIA